MARPRGASTSLKAARCTGSLSTSTPSKSKSVAITMDASTGTCDRGRGRRDEASRCHEDDSRDFRRGADAGRGTDGAKTAIDVERGAAHEIGPGDVFEERIERPRAWIDLAT